MLHAHNYLTKSCTCTGMRVMYRDRMSSALPETEVPSACEIWNEKLMTSNVTTRGHCKQSSGSAHGMYILCVYIAPVTLPSLDNLD